MAKSEIREIYFTSEVNFPYFTSSHQVYVLTKLKKSNPCKGRCNFADSNAMAVADGSGTVESTEEYFNGLQITADGNGAIRLCDNVSVTTTT